MRVLYMNYKDVKPNSSAPNYGQPWSARDKQTLVDMYMDDCRVGDMAQALGRDERGVCCKLVGLGLLEQDMSTYNFYRKVLPEKGKSHVLGTKSMPPLLGDPKKVIETITLIRGVRGDQVDDDSIFGIIGELEGSIADLSTIKNQPKKLKAKLASIQADIDALVAYVDGRES